MIVLVQRLVPADADAATFGDAFDAARTDMLNAVGRDRGLTPWTAEPTRLPGVQTLWRCTVTADLTGQVYAAEVIQRSYATYGADDRCRLCGAHFADPHDRYCPQHAADLDTADATVLTRADLARV